MPLEKKQTPSYNWLVLSISFSIPEISLPTVFFFANEKRRWENRPSVGRRNVVVVIPSSAAHALPPRPPGSVSPPPLWRPLRPGGWGVVVVFFGGWNMCRDCYLKTTKQGGGEETKKYKCCWFFSSFDVIYIYIVCFLVKTWKTNVYKECFWAQGGVFYSTYGIRDVLFSFRDELW